MRITKEDVKVLQENYRKNWETKDFCKASEVEKIKDFASCVYIYTRAQKNLRNRIEKLYPEYVEKIKCIDPVTLHIAYVLHISYEKAIEIEKKLHQIAESFCGASEYSMGETIFIDHKNKTLYKYDNRHFYGGKYRGGETHGRITIELEKKEIFNLQEIEGLWTVRLDKERAKWLSFKEGKGNKTAYWVQGYLYGQSHSTISYLDAKHIQMRKGIALLKKIKENEINQYRFIGVPHLRAVGACDAGINNALQAKGINLSKIGGMRIDKALQIFEKEYQRKYILSAAKVAQEEMVEA